MSQDGKPRSVVSKRLCCGTAVVLSLICMTLLFLMIMALNGTLPAIRDWNYVRPGEVDQSKYAVVSQTMQQCRPDLPMRIHSLMMTPDPLEITPNSKIGNLQQLTYDMTLLGDVPEEQLTIKLMIQRLTPPWQEVPCIAQSGSCNYVDSCTTLGKIFGFNSCTEMKAGNYTDSVDNLMLDLDGPFHWATPGNYFVQVRVDYRDQPYGCVDLTFRIKNKT